MIKETGLNNSIQKSKFYADLSSKTLNSINKSLTRLSRLYDSKNSIKIENKLTKITNEEKSLLNNNQQYIGVFERKISEYKQEASEYAESFETLGDLWYEKRKN